jgi:hypothetical protein
MKTAEDMTSTLARPGETSDDPVDQIAELFTGESESEDKDEKDDENQTDASTESDEEEESDEEAESEDSELEEIAEGDSTWESVLGVSEDKLSFDEAGNVSGVNIKVDGESSTISMGDLIAGYQTNKSVTQRSQAFAEEKKAFDGQKEQTEQLYASKLESVDALSTYFEKQLISEYDGVDWDKLRTEDPAEYAAARHDFSAKADELQKIKDAISQDKASQQEGVSETQSAKAQEYMKTQYDLMIDKNPEWSDEKVRDTARDSFKKFVNDQYGFTDQEFNSVFDARLIEVIKDAQKYHEGAKVANKKMKKIVPKFQKSKGTGTKSPVSKLDKLTAASKKATGSQRRDLEVSAVAELLTGG